jgi:LuxR family transcriptional regulator, quorum-sensing system regulator ExpR
MSKNFFSNSEKNNYIKVCLEKRLEKYGKMNFVYAVMNKRNPDDMMIISDFSDELVNNYLNNKQQHIDPVIINALSRISSFSWDENLKINYQWAVKSVFEPIKPYNIISGHAFVVHDQNNNLVVLSLYVDKLLMEETGDMIKRHADEIQGTLIYVHEMLLHAYQEDSRSDKESLSSRESEILYWCSTGKTYPEVAGILKIAVSTVKFYMANIVKKMGVKNAKHAISLGIELNLISPPSGK